MKAYEIMMFLFIFNVMVALFGTLGLFAFGFDTSTIPTMIGTLAVGSVLALLVGAAVWDMVSKSRATTASVAYATFGTMYTITLISSMALINSMAAQYDYLGASLVFTGLFGALAAYAFIIGLIQMTTGGWRGYQ